MPAAGTKSKYIFAIVNYSITGNKYKTAKVTVVTVNEPVVLKQN